MNFRIALATAIGLAYVAAAPLAFGGGAANLPVSGCESGWIWINPAPGPGSHQRAIVSKAGLVVYDRVGSGAYVSRDTGATWEYITVRKLPSGEYESAQSAQVISTGIVFSVDNSTRGLYRSTDGGLGWIRVAVLPYEFTSIYMVTEGWGLGVVMDSIGPNMQNVPHVYVTRDSGKHWALILTRRAEIQGELPDLFCLDSLHWWIRQYYHASRDTLCIFYTHNGGQSWEEDCRQVPLDSGVVWWPGLFEFSDTLNGVAGVNGEPYSSAVFWRTTNGGKLWVEFPEAAEMRGDFQRNIWWKLDKSGMLQVLTTQSADGGISRSPTHAMFATTTDYGITWRRDSAYPIPRNAAWTTRGLDVWGNGCGMVFGDYGLLTVTSDHGRTWSRNNQFGELIKGIDFSDRSKGFVIAGEWDSKEGGFYRTVDGGRHWKAHPQIPAGVLYYSHPAPNVLFLGDETHVYRSVDSGATFREIRTLPTRRSIIAGVAFVDSTYGWLFAAGRGIWKTTDAGNTWQQQAADSTEEKDYTRFRSASMLDRTFGYAWWNGNLVRTTNGGDSWDTVNAMYNLSMLVGIQFMDRTHGYIYGAGPTSETTDGGLTWHNLGVGGMDFHFRDSLLGWVAGMVTTDGGSTWLRRTCSSISALYSSWVDTGMGWSVDYNYEYWVYHYGPFDSVTVSVADLPPAVAVPVTTLLENYPNPFSQTTYIELPTLTVRDVQSTEQWLQVYDILGRNVTAGFDFIIAGEGTRVVIDGRRQQSGTYFVRSVRSGREYHARVVLSR